MEEKIFEENILMKDFTTYKIGGRAEYFFVAKTKNDLEKAVQTAQKMKLNVLVLGGGSNMLVADKGIKGLVIKVDISGVEFRQGEVFAGAGEILSKFVYSCSNAGFSGLEWAAGIPGATVGGAIFGNAQAFGTKISDSVKSVEVLDLKTMEILNLNKEQCHFSLKNSEFKKNKNLIILSAIFELNPGKAEEIKEKIDRYLAYRNNNHPINFPSAGSTFVNPEIKITNKKLLEKFPELAGFNEKGVIPAGFLIQKCGLQGKKIGDAQISEKHANFIINTGDAKAKDVLALMKLAKQKVKKTFNINLETEVQLIGF